MLFSIHSFFLKTDILNVLKNVLLTASFQCGDTIKVLLEILLKRPYFHISPSLSLLQSSATVVFHVFPCRCLGPLKDASLTWFVADIFVHRRGCAAQWSGGRARRTPSSNGMDAGREFVELRLCSNLLGLLSTICLQRLHRYLTGRRVQDLRARTLTAAQSRPELLD